MTTKTFLTIIIWTVLSSRSDSFIRTMQINQLQGDASLDGLGCAVSEYKSARGIEFEASTETCRTLNKTWFANTSFQAGHNYYELINVKEKVKTVTNVYMPLPNNFRIGDSVVLFFEKKANVTGSAKIQVDLLDGDAVLGRFGVNDHIYLHINNIKYPGYLMVSSFINGGWSGEHSITDPFTGRTGKMELLVSTNLVEVYVNDVSVFNYSTPVRDHLILLSHGPSETDTNETYLLYRN